MSLPISTFKSTVDCSAQIERLKSELESADAVVVGAGSGLSTSAGHTYDGRRFEQNFSDFISRYHYHDMYSAGFYPYSSLEEHWAYWSRHIYFNRYDRPVGQPYLDLLRLLKGKDYFVITTNVDHCFQDAGFDKNRLFYTQGDYGLLQCSGPCHQKTYDNEITVRQMIAQQKDMRIPSELIPHCPVCGKPMTINLRCDDTFVQDEGWYAARYRYENFLNAYEGKHLLFLELGVGYNTPVIIKYPFWKMTSENSKAVYACINSGEASCSNEIESQSICIDADIGKALSEVLKQK